MAYVRSKENENIESLLIRFKAKVKREGILWETKQRREYIKPCEKRRDKRRNKVSKSRASSNKER